MNKQKYLYEVSCYPYSEYGLYTSLEDDRIAFEKRIGGNNENTACIWFTHKVLKTRWI